MRKFSCVAAVFFIVFAAIVAIHAAPQDQPILTPRISSNWWKIAGNPDLGDLNGEGQVPTAFGIWQADDGTWQLWSCVRGTKVGGETRLFYRWQGDHVTDGQWRGMGVAMTADSSVGETPGGLQAPHAVRIGHEYVMVYGDWENICMARSADGKTFERQLTPAGQSGMFSEGPGSRTRDGMLMVAGDTYYLYYAAAPENRGAIYCRTSTDLRNWSSPTIVSSGGSAGDDFESAESPFVLYLEQADAYYLFRSHRTADREKFVTSVYRSEDPLNFGVESDELRVATMDIEGIWIVQQDDDYYIASLMPDFSGTRVARLTWVREQLPQ